MTEAMIRAMASPIRDYVAAFADRVRVRFADQAHRIDALEQRIVALEAKRLMSYAGVWRAGVDYGRDAVTTDHGALWLATCASPVDRPGTSGQWKLIAKNGDRSDR